MCTTNPVCQQVETGGEANQVPVKGTDIGFVGVVEIEDHLAHFVIGIANILCMKVTRKPDVDIWLRLPGAGYGNRSVAQISIVQMSGPTVKLRGRSVHLTVLLAFDQRIGDKGIRIRNLRAQKISLCLVICAAFPKVEESTIKTINSISV